MPLNDCQSEGLPGVKWGKAGKCYTYQPGDEAGREAAVAKALAQAVAIGDLPADEAASAAPDSRRFAACGNGVVAPVAYWIGMRLASVLA